MKLDSIERIDTRIVLIIWRLSFAKISIAFVLCFVWLKILIISPIDMIEIKVFKTTKQC